MKNILLPSLTQTFCYASLLKINLEESLSFFLNLIQFMDVTFYLRFSFFT